MSSPLPTRRHSRPGALFLSAWLYRRLSPIMDARPPDQVIGPPKAPYLQRWWIVKRRFFNLYLHRVPRSDDDRALHDHPSWNMSIILDGGYVEVMPTQSWQLSYVDFERGGLQRKRRGAGKWLWRSAHSRHRLEVAHEGAVTLWMRGPTIHGWGFYCRKGFVPWQEFVKPNAPGEVGRGCGD